MMRDLFEVMLEHCGGADFASEPREHRHLLSTRERGAVMTMAADRRQAGVILAYVVGLLER